ncbi:MAG: NurA domain-containing protein [Cycloclasticus sp.]|nr:NurA domain-containing protein [Cycloclasticus sp.]MBG96818.1 NurA domain-containing protein [Cycloclasticus sp.]HAI96785.1 NurA domain-containing protein [Methylococcaceae bacterium]|tara:strand:- start:242 stop:1603 length:1362 start_codon:yes stop_codon:yes gene_type:complete
MGTTSRSHKPNEWAAKINHTHVIKDPFIQKFLDNCDTPKDAEDIEEKDKNLIFKLDENIENPIHHILAVDGGYTTVEVKKSFPSSQIAFFQFGALLFKKDDLDSLSQKSFIFPEDMQKLHNLHRFKLAIPIRNIISKDQKSLTGSVRKIIYDFFMQQRESSSFMETLSWFIFEEYKSNSLQSYVLSNDPNKGVGSGKVELKKSDMSKDYTFDFGAGIIYLTDIFRLDEAIDDEQGAGGILGYLTRLIEQIILVHFIRSILKLQPALLKKFLFITDGPLSFSGQTANMHKPMRELCNYLLDNETLFLVGLEKSGAFVEHAHEISLPKEGKVILNTGNFILLSNEYIYKYIVPGDHNNMHYGSTSYYGGKVIYHSADGQVIVLSVPVSNKEVIKNPELNFYLNLEMILVNIQKLKCDMYDDSIIPVALANKLVSLANHPSKILLEKFAANGVNHG